MCLDLFLISRDRFTPILLLSGWALFATTCMHLRDTGMTLIFREQNQTTWPMEVRPLHLSNTGLRALCLQSHYGNTYKALCCKIESFTASLCWIPWKLFFPLSLDLVLLVQAALNPKCLLGLCFFCLSLLVFIFSFGQLSFCAWLISDSAFALFY